MRGFTACASPALNRIFFGLLGFGFTASTGSLICTELTTSVVHPPSESSTNNAETGITVLIWLRRPCRGVEWSLARSEGCNHRGHLHYPQMLRNRSIALELPPGR